MDNYTWNVRVRSASGGHATAYVRSHQVEIGPPLSFDEQEPRVTALEHLMAALGADLVNGLRMVGRARRLAIHDAEAVLAGKLNNPLSHLGVIGEQGHPGVEHIAVRVYVSADADDEQLQTAWKETLERSPLVHTLQRSVTLDLTMKVVV